MNALAVAPDGTTLGLLAQTYWARGDRVTVDRHQRPFDAKEARYWEVVTAAATATQAAHAPDTVPWFQKDRGADSAELLLRDLRDDRLMTVRVSYDRRICGPLAHVRAAVMAAPVAGVYGLAVPAGPHRQARVAQIEVRSVPLDLHLHERLANRDWSAAVWVVWAREVGTTPAGEPPIEWLLYTTYPVEDFGDAILVLVGYSYRWRLEEFHKTWKSGACRVHDTELRTADRILIWATLLGAVATRLMQLRDASRSHPDAAATAWVSGLELKAIVLLRQPRRVHPDAPVTLGEAVRWVADLGGYTGPSSGGPPGLIVLRRGWERVQTACEVLRKLSDAEK
jgi:hypothetical protein